MFKKITKTCVLVIALLSLTALVFTACGSGSSASIQSVTGATSSQAAAIERIIRDAGIEIESIEAVTDEDADELSEMLNFTIEAYDIVSTDGNLYGLLLNGDTKAVILLADDYGNFLYGSLESLFENIFDDLFDGLDLF